MAKHKAKVSKEGQANTEFQAMVNEHAQSLRKRLEELRVVRIEAPQMFGQVSMAPPRGMLAKEASFYQSRMYLTGLYNPDDISVEDKDLAYIAGLFDGEVALGIHHSGRSYSLGLRYNKVNYDILEFLSNIFGGAVSPVKPQPYHRFKVWEWHLTSGNAYRALRKLYPFLRVKQESAAICIEFFEHYWQGHRGKPVSHERQAVGRTYAAKLKLYQTKSMPHKRKK